MVKRFQNTKHEQNVVHLQYKRIYEDNNKTNSYHFTNQVQAYKSGKVIQL